MVINRLTNDRQGKLGLGILILFLTGFGSVLAANMSINSGVTTREFGQGTYQIKACDSWIKLDLLTGATGERGAPVGLSALTGITISGLDTKACASTFFSISILDSNAQKLPIYRTDRFVSLCGELRCVQGENSQEELALAISANGKVTLSLEDPFHLLSYDPNTAVYSVTLVQPSILANEVGRLNIQSSSAKVINS